MHKIVSVVTSAASTPFASLTLPFEKRQICRQRVVLDNGDEASLIIDRGTILRDGDVLSTESGQFIQVRAADESVSTLYTEDCLQLARAAYHLGNRHVSLEVRAGRLRYLHGTMPVGRSSNTRRVLAAFSPRGRPRRNARRSRPALGGREPSDTRD